MRRAIAMMLLLVLPSPSRAEEWSFGPSGFLFAPPHESAYVSLMARADRERVHLEARYNYESLETVSAFIGWNLAAGDDIALAVTPMLGLVAGEISGIAPGLEAEVTWRKLAFDVESEYVFDLDASDDSFLYAWLETTYAPTGWLRAGIVAQRTVTYQTGLDVQRGLMAEASRGGWSLGAYWFNPDRGHDGFFVASLSYEF